MPTPKRKKVENPRRDPDEIIAELETKLESLQRDYQKCQTQLEKVLEENEELKKLLKIGASSVKQNDGNPRKRSSLRRSLRRFRISQRPEEFILPDLEGSDGDRMEEEDDLLINMKQDFENVDYTAEPEEESNDDGPDGSDNSSPGQTRFQTRSDDDNEQEDLKINRSPSPKLKVTKQLRENNKAEITRRKMKSRHVRTRREAQNEPKGLEIDIVNFLDDIISIPKKNLRTATPDAISTFDFNGLAEFHVVLGKKLEFYTRDEAKKLSPNPISNELSTRRELRYFSSIPTESPHINVDVPRLRFDMLTTDSKPPARNKSKRREGPKSDVLPPVPITFKQNLCSTFNEEEPFVFICEICGTPFDNSAKFTRHMISHSEPTHPCLVCGRLFKRKDDLAKHINGVHEKVYRYQCRMCPKQFTESSGFRKHERSHLNIRPHLCNECGRGFAELRNLRNHTVKQHNGEDLPHRVKLVV